jgi:Na+/citrate or Na+/malate symporter
MDHAVTAMPQPDKISATERRRRGQIRLAAIVMAATMVLWMAASFLGGRLGLPVRFAFLIDLAAIAALVWALFVTYWVWKARREDASDG